LLRKALGNSTAIAQNEKSSNVTGTVLNLRQYRLDPLLAVKFILTSFHYKVKIAAGCKTPRLPDFRIIEKDNNYCAITYHVRLHTSNSFFD
jgi:hypothetical protein